MNSQSIALAGDKTANAEVVQAPRAGQQVASLQGEGSTILAVIQRAASDPACDIEKMERLMQMHERFVDRSASAAFNAAMVRAQSRMGMVARNGYNDHTKSSYALLEDIDRAISPIYTSEGFSLAFSTEDAPLAGHVRVVCDAMHAEGHTKRFRVDLPLDGAGAAGKANKTGVHAHGSTYSYARRYLTLMIFNVVMGDEDDDGQAAGAPAAKGITPAQRLALEKVVAQCSPPMQARVAEDFPDLSMVPAHAYDAMMASLKAKAAKYQDSLKQGAQQ